MLHLGALRRVALPLRPLLWRAAALRDGHDLVVAQLFARRGRRLVYTNLGDYGNIITVLVVDEDEADALLRFRGARVCSPFYLSIPLGSVRVAEDAPPRSTQHALSVAAQVRSL